MRPRSRAVNGDRIALIAVEDRPAEDVDPRATEVAASLFATAPFASNASIEHSAGLPVNWCPRSHRESRRAPPTDHTPRSVSAGDEHRRPGFDQGGRCKELSLVATARPPTRADARSASAVKFCVLRSAASVMLVQSAYGKSRVRVMQVARHGDRHDVSDLTVAVRFQGAVRRVLYRRGQSRGPADRHHQEHRVCAGCGHRHRRTRKRWGWYLRATSSKAIRGWTKSGSISRRGSGPGSAGTATRTMATRSWAAGPTCARPR